MTVQNILVPFQAEEEGAIGFKAAITFAKHFKAHMDVVHIRRRFPMPAVSYYPIAGAYLEENAGVLAASEERVASELKDVYEKLRREHGVSAAAMTSHAEALGATAEWSDLESSYTFDFANRARLADLTITTNSADGGGDQKELIEELIFQSGRPVLITGDERPLEGFPKTVVVAWDGGREAARALSTALPVLKEAETVFVTSVGGVKRAVAPPEQAAAYLRLHGVHALHAQLDVRKGQSAEERFLEHVEGKGADLVVMGAYSHNRWREVVLGGFTRHMMNRSSLSVIMAH